MPEQEDRGGEHLSSGQIWTSDGKYLGAPKSCQCVILTRSARERLDRLHFVGGKGEVVAGQVLLHVLGVGGAGQR